mgnify:CR=1 FL=1
MRELGLPADRIRVMTTSTDKVPNTSATAASSGADLNGADLNGANLRDADLENAYHSRRIVGDGELTGYKKLSNGVVAELRIPADARRVGGLTGRKCRAEFVDVLDVFGADFGVTDNHGPKTEYRVGQRVTPDSWDDNWQNECSHGVHFFITREEAEDYQ